jgi:SAM-dependent methyltransferase
MTGVLDAALADPWGTLDSLVDGPLHPGGREATAALLDRADVDEGTRLVDVGCGAGAAVETARERCADAWGIDRDPKTARAVRGEATCLPFATGSVDVVLAECVLCLTALPQALGEVDRVLADGGRLAVSDVVVDPDNDPRGAVPDAVAELLCLTGARSREQLYERIEAAGLTVAETRDHGDDLLAMRDRIAAEVDYVGLLSAMGERGRELQAGIERVEDAIEAGDVGYVSVVARA